MQILGSFGAAEGAAPRALDVSGAVSDAAKMTIGAGWRKLDLSFFEGSTGTGLELALCCKLLILRWIADY
jgi:hypothetical protein